MIKNLLLLFTLFGFSFTAIAQKQGTVIYPSSTEVVKPIYKSSFDKDGSCKQRKQGGNPRFESGYLVFDGAMDGYRQVDPQIAVGGNYILHGTNNGLLIYDKQGNYVQGVHQSCFNNGIDPKMFYDVHSKVFVFDLWWYWDKPGTKPVNISISETNDPTKGWNTYPISRKYEADGGGIGYSKKWIGYCYPSNSDDKEEMFVMQKKEALKGEPATVYHFAGEFGHPVLMQDNKDDLYFLAIEDKNIKISKLSEGKDGKPFVTIVSNQPHDFTYYQYPPQSPQKNTEQKTSSGDRNPKNVVFQNGSIWFSHAVNCNDRSAVQWHQIEAQSGKILQSGVIKSDTSNYIQTTMAVNKNSDVMIGFQEVNKNMFISPRFTFRKNSDKKGTVRPIVKIGEGRGFTDGTAWGDYSGTIIDGDNLLDMWTVQSCANEQGKGETVIAKLPL